MNFQRSPILDPQYKTVPPLSLYEFRKIATSEGIFLPELPARRKCTDVTFLIMFILSIIVLISLCIYIVASGNTVKELHGRDISATTNITNIIDNNEKEILMTDVALENFVKLLVILLMMVVAAIGLCILMYFAFKCNAFITFWTLMGFEFLLAVIVLIIFWVLFIKSRRFVWLLAALSSTVFLLALSALLYLLRKRFRLVIALYEETLKAIFSFPVLLLLPIPIFLALLSIISVLIYTSLFAVNSDVDNRISLFAVSFFIFMTYWLNAFATGLQCMLVAGSVASYYFTRDKSMLRKSIIPPFFVTTRYHLGTIALGSLIITIISMIKTMFTALRDNSSISVLVICCSVCISFIKQIVEYLTKKAYIMTAIHGRSFCPSGVRGARMIWLFLIDTIAIDGLGMVAMHAASVLITLGCLAIGTGVTAMVMSPVEDAFIFLFIGTFLTGIVTFWYISIMNVAVETIFICFCEDKLLNDGSINRPYFMSAELLLLVTDAIEMAYKQRKQQEDRLAPENAENRN